MCSLYDTDYDTDEDNEVVLTSYLDRKRRISSPDVDGDMDVPDDHKMCPPQPGNVRKRRRQRRSSSLHNPHSDSDLAHNHKQKVLAEHARNALDDIIDTESHLHAMPGHGDVDPVQPAAHDVDPTPTTTLSAQPHAQTQPQPQPQQVCTLQQQQQHAQEQEQEMQRFAASFAFKLKPKHAEQEAKDAEPPVTVSNHGRKRSRDEWRPTTTTTGQDDGADDDDVDDDDNLQVRKKHKPSDPFRVHFPTTFSRSRTVRSSAVRPPPPRRDARKTKSQRMPAAQSNPKKDPFAISLPATVTATTSTATTTKLQSIPRVSASSATQLNRTMTQHSQIRSHEDSFALHHNVSMLHAPARSAVHVEDIQETRVTNEDLQSLSTPNRVTTTTTTNAAQKLEMDASDDDNGNDDVDEAHYLVGTTPQWLHELTHQARRQQQFRQQMLLEHETSSSNDKKHKHKHIHLLEHETTEMGPFQRGVVDLKLSNANRCNLVQSYAPQIGRIPANLGVTQQMVLKILRCRRMSLMSAANAHASDLYVAICATLHDDDDSGTIEYVLVYFEAPQFEELQIGDNDFVSIYRPWTEKYVVAKHSTNVGSAGKLSKLRMILGCCSVIRHAQPNDAQAIECDRYPDYDVSVFRPMIEAPRRCVRSAEEVEMDVEMEMDEAEEPSTCVLATGDRDANGSENVQKHVHDIESCSPTQKLPDDDEEEEDDLYWLENMATIDAVTQQYGTRRPLTRIAEIPMFDTCATVMRTRADFDIKAMIQRVYLTPQLLSAIEVDVETGGGGGVEVASRLQEHSVSLLVEDESCHCCLIAMDLLCLLQTVHVNGDVDRRSPVRLTAANMDADTLRLRLAQLMRLESQWFIFEHIEQLSPTTKTKMRMETKEEVQSLLYQFEYKRLRDTGGGGNHNMQHGVGETTDTTEASDIRLYGQLALRTGTFLQHAKLYYHFEHFACAQSQSEHMHSMVAHKQYCKHLQLRHFQCASMKKTQTLKKHPSGSTSNTQYEPSLIFSLREIGVYLAQYWNTKGCSTRISLVVRVTAKSYAYENVVYVTDNSLWPLDAMTGDPVVVPLVVEDTTVLAMMMICKNSPNENFSNTELYQQQPLFILRDVALYYDTTSQTQNVSSVCHRLCLRFDSFSIAERVSAIEITADHRKLCYHSQRGRRMMTPTQLCSTPWKALDSTMCKLNGEVQFVCMDDGFESQCVECAQISKGFGGQEETQHIPCITCLRQKGEIRVALKVNENENQKFVVLIVSVSDVWYGIANGISVAIDWGKCKNDPQMFVKQLEQLKHKLTSEFGLSQCVIEYVTHTHGLSSDHVSNVQCFYCFHFVIA